MTQTNSIEVKTRYEWVDWMKAIGMYLIVLGHLYPLGHEYIYVFNVLLFFIISGFLSKKEKNMSLFWSKLWKNLVLPCVIICLFMHVYFIVMKVQQGTFRWVQIPLHVLNCLAGFHGKSFEAGGLGLCWFIYTLALCKVIHQLAINHRWIQWAVISFCIVFSVWYNNESLGWYNAWSNTALAYPMYAIGRGYKKLFDNGLLIQSAWMAVFIATLCFSIVAVVGYWNGAPWMFNNLYGENIVLFFVGGTFGSLGIWALTYLIGRNQLPIINTISRGNIVILGFQLVAIRLWSHFAQSYQWEILKYIGALVIMLFFVPIISLTERYFPILLGMRVKNNENNQNLLIL